MPLVGFLSYLGHMAVTEVSIPEWSLPDRLLKSRRHAGLEQDDLCDAIGIARSSLSKYENGHAVPRRHVLIAWAQVTGVPLEWLEGARSRCSAWIDQPTPPDLHQPYDVPLDLAA